MSKWNFVGKNKVPYNNRPQRKGAKAWEDPQEEKPKNNNKNNIKFSENKMVQNNVQISSSNDSYCKEVLYKNNGFNNKILIDPKSNQ